MEYLKPQSHDLKTWQKKLMAILEDPADDRHVVWCEDPEGGNGKTWLSKHI